DFGLGIVIATNRVSGAAEAVMSSTKTTPPVVSASSVLVTATDHETVDAPIMLSVITVSVTGNTSEKASAVNGIASLNDVRGGAKAHIEDYNVSAATITVTATDIAQIHADVTSEAVAVALPLSTMLSSQSLAINGVIATNLVLGGADAFALNSTLT